MRLMTLFILLTSCGETQHHISLYAMINDREEKIADFYRLSYLAEKDCEYMARNFEEYRCTLEYDAK